MNSAIRHVTDSELDGDYETGNDDRNRTKQEQHKVQDRCNLSGKGNDSSAKDPPRSATAATDAANEFVDTLIQIGQDWQLGNFDAVFTMVETKFPLLSAHRAVIKRLMSEIHAHIDATNEAFFILHHEFKRLHELYAQLAARPLWDISGRAKLSVALTKHLISIPTSLRSLSLSSDVIQEEPLQIANYTHFDP